LNVVDSVITQDPSGNIGIGTFSPAAALDVAAGDVNLAGNLLKGGTLFLHSPGATQNNTFLGKFAGNLTMTGEANTGTGFGALQSIGNGNQNTAAGNFALLLNTSGSGNTAVGANALLANASGDGNTAVGVSALNSYPTGDFITAVGFLANVSMAGLTNATAIGFGAVVDASNKIRLGNADVTVIEGQVPYTFTSDKNQKENFRSVDGESVLRKIGGLTLTSWNYIGHDPQQLRHYGPVAQEFFTAFGHDAVGTVGTPTTINSGDMEGILMIAVQALEKRTAENVELKARIEALEAVVKAMHAERR